MEFIFVSSNRFYRTYRCIQECENSQVEFFYYTSHCSSSFILLIWFSFFCFVLYIHTQYFCSPYRLWFWIDSCSNWIRQFIEIRSRIRTSMQYDMITDTHWTFESFNILCMECSRSKVRCIPKLRNVIQNMRIVWYFDCIPKRVMCLLYFNGALKMFLFSAEQRIFLFVWIVRFSFHNSVYFFFSISFSYAIIRLLLSHHGANGNTAV